MWYADFLHDTSLSVQMVSNLPIVWFVIHDIPFPLQSVKNALAEEGECCAPIPHPFDQLQCVHLSLHETVALRQGQACFHCFLVSFYASHKALQLADLTGPHFLKPSVELFSCASTKHLGKLLDQLICLIHLSVQRSKQGQRFLVLGL